MHGSLAESFLVLAGEDACEDSAVPPPPADPVLPRMLESFLLLEHQDALASVAELADDVAADTGRSATSALDEAARRARAKRLASLLQAVECASSAPPLCARCAEECTSLVDAVRDKDRDTLAELRRQLMRLEGRLRSGSLGDGGSVLTLCPSKPVDPRHELDVLREDLSRARLEVSQLEAQTDASRQRISTVSMALDGELRRGAELELLGAEHEHAELLRGLRLVGVTGRELQARDAAPLLRLLPSRPYPRVNGYRLAAAAEPSLHLNWPEVNAAWAQLALAAFCCRARAAADAGGGAAEEAAAEAEAWRRARSEARRAREAELDGFELVERDGGPGGGGGPGDEGPPGSCGGSGGGGRGDADGARGGTAGGTRGVGAGLAQRLVLVPLRARPFVKDLVTGESFSVGGGCGAARAVQLKLGALALCAYAAGAPGYNPPELLYGAADLFSRYLVSPRRDRLRRHVEKRVDAAAIGRALVTELAGLLRGDAPPVASG